MKQFSFKEGFLHSRKINHILTFYLVLAFVERKRQSLLGRKFGIVIVGAILQGIATLGKFLFTNRVNTNMETEKRVNLIDIELEMRKKYKNSLPEHEITGSNAWKTKVQIDTSGNPPPKIRVQNKIAN
jgi:hypothetical protein